MNSSDDNPFAIGSRLHPGGTDSSSTTWTTHASGKVDYLISGGFSNEDTINKSISGTYMSFSPIAKARVPKAQTTNTASYPSQQLNSRFEADPIPDEENTFAKPPPPLPPPIVLSSSLRPSGEVSSNPSISVQNFPVVDQIDAIKEVSVEHLDGFIIGLSDSPAREAATALHSFKSGGDATNEKTGDVRVKSTRTSATNPTVNAAKTRTLPMKKRNENTRKEGAGVGKPGRFDILRGRGGLTNHHAGNIKFRNEARALRTDYRNATTNQQKYAYSVELVKKVKAYGGKFLEKGSDGLWYEIDEESARKKASQVLREERWE
jgi:hypothetical protein